jgi:hypothetical protein
MTGGMEFWVKTKDKQMRSFDLDDKLAPDEDSSNERKRGAFAPP